MDYKKIIKSRALRLKIIQLLSFIPDKPMIKLQYRIKTGHRLNLNNPRRFTEKLQWYKLYYKNPKMVQCVDKYDVREYVKSKGLESILVPCYGVFDSAAEINWESLPNEFVMKDTLGCGGNSVIIVRDKEKEDISRLNSIANEWTKQNAHKPFGGREWPYYSGKKHRIIIEKLLKSNERNGPSCNKASSHEDLVEYKYFCFNGKATWIYVLADRKMGKNVGVGIYDKNFKRQKAVRADEKPLQQIVEKPTTFNLMKEIAKILSDEFPEARIDLYDVNGEIKFGEITFYDGSGYMTFEPDEFDIIFGDSFDLPPKMVGCHIA